MKKICISSRCCKPGNQRILKHITASSCVFSNYNFGLSVLVVLTIEPSEKTSHLKCMLHSEVHISLSSESICSKIFTHISLHSADAFASKLISNISVYPAIFISIVCKYYIPSGLFFCHLHESAHISCRFFFAVQPSSLAALPASQKLTGTSPALLGLNS